MCALSRYHKTRDFELQLRKLYNKKCASTGSWRSDVQTISLSANIQNKTLCSFSFMHTKISITCWNQATGNLLTDHFIVVLKSYSCKKTKEVLTLWQMKTKNQKRYCPMLTNYKPRYVWYCLVRILLYVSLLQLFRGPGSCSRFSSNKSTCYTKNKQYFNSSVWFWHENCEVTTQVRDENARKTNRWRGSWLELERTKFKMASG